MKTKWRYQIYRNRPLLFRMIFSPGSFFTTGHLIHETDRHRIVESGTIGSHGENSDTHHKLVSLLKDIERNPGVIVDICLNNGTTWAKIVRTPNLNDDEKQKLIRHIEQALKTIEAEHPA